MKLKEFIDNNEVIFTKNVVASESIKTIEKELDVLFGDELTQYILEYGFLGYKHIELYGINSKQMSESDMVKQTKYLHKYFPKTSKYIALENKGDGEYILVSPNDDICEYFSEEDLIHKTGDRLFDYIVNRFQEADK